jgi:hypothetical protein
MIRKSTAIERFKELSVATAEFVASDDDGSPTAFNRIHNPR